MILLQAFLLAAAVQASDEDCTALAQKIETSVSTEKGAWIDQSFDVATMMDRALRGAPGDDKMKQEYTTGIRKGFNIGRSTAAAAAKDGSYTFLRLRTVNGKKLALFRLLTDGAFNYHEYLLEASPSGGVRIVDLYIYLSGENISQSFRRIYVNLAASEPGVVGKLVGNQNEMVEGLKQLQAMNKLIQQRKHAEALKIYRGMPESMQKEKVCLVARLQAGTQVSPKESMDALEALRKEYPGDPAILALSLDPLLLAKRFDEVIAAVDELDKSVGGDPYLDTMRASVHLEKGDADQARACAKRSIEKDKTLAMGYWTLVAISLRTKTFADTVSWLNEIEKNLGLEIGDLSKIEMYGEFMKSPEHAAWRKSRDK